jgi:hypothetical protein
MATTMVDVMKFFGYSSTAAFAVDWKRLNDTDKKQLKAGIDDGSLGY